MDDNGTLGNFFIQDHYLIKKSQVYCPLRLESKELYNMHILLNTLKPTSLCYYENLF